MRPDGERLVQHEALFLKFKDLAGIGEFTAAAPKVRTGLCLLWVSADLFYDPLKHECASFIKRCTEVMC